MTKNMGAAVRLIRILIATPILILLFTSEISGIGFLVVSLFFLATGVVGYCPLFTILGLNSLVKN